MSRAGTTAFHKAARLSGIFGFVFLAIVVLTFVDAFTQIWVARPGYEGTPILVAFALLGAASLASFALAVIDWLTNRTLSASKPVYRVSRCV